MRFWDDSLTIPQHKYKQKCPNNVQKIRGKTKNSPAPDLLLDTVLITAYFILSQIELLS